MTGTYKSNRVAWTPSIVAASLAGNALALAMPLAILQVYDRVVPNRGTETLTALGAGLAIAIAADYVVRGARGRLIATAAADLEVRAGERALDRAFSPGADPFWEGDGIDLHERFAAIDLVRRHRGGEAAVAILDLPFLIAFMALLAYISPIFGAGALAITFGAMLMSRIQRRRIDRLQVDHVDRGRRRHRFLSESIERMEVIRALGAEGQMERRYERLMSGTVGLTRDLTAEIHFTQGLAGAIGLMAPVLMSALGAYLVVENMMSVGGLAAGVLLTGRIIQPVLRLEAMRASERDATLAERTVEGLLTAPRTSEGAHTITAVENLALQDVTWSPDPDAPPVLKGVDMVLRRGDCISVEGGDAQARSALLALLAGLRRPHAGRALVNGIDVTDIHPASLSDRVSLLEPDARMVPGTVFQNLCAQVPARHATEALELADRLTLSAALAEHPAGMHAPVGLSGTAGLSGATHGIVMLVAGLVRKPDVILFDEANSHLDAEADAAFLALLRTRLPDAIVVLVTFRPSYRKLAGLRCVIENGHVSVHRDGAPLEDRRDRIGNLP